MSTMKILYVSSLVSNALFDDFYKKGLTTGFVGQKYHGLFAKGLSALNQECHVTALSLPPVNKSFFKLKEPEDNIRYRYVPIVAFPGIKQIIYFIYTFLYTLYWCLKNIRSEKIIMSSLMRIYQYPSVWLGACLFRCKQYTIACDVPWMTTIQVTTSKLSLKEQISIWLGKKLCAFFDGYIFLTEAMNEVLNPKNRPYIVIEGFCDHKMANIPNRLEDKEEKRIIIYAGGLNIKYGILNLVEAIKELHDDSIELWLFGSGDLDEILKKETSQYIRFFGPRSNDEVISAEIKATILINPRPTADEYTIYSFPSKTLEYMVSGTYTMTTRLNGIPAEYFNYCGVIEDYSIKGIVAALSATLEMSNYQLHKKGILAKEFVLKNKNNKTQAKRVIDFIHGIK